MFWQKHCPTMFLTMFWKSLNIVRTMHISDVFMTIFVPRWNQEVQVHPMQQAFQSKYQEGSLLSSHWGETTEVYTLQTGSPPDFKKASASASGSGNLTIHIATTESGICQWRSISTSEIKVPILISDINHYKCHPNWDWELSLHCQNSLQVLWRLVVVSFILNLTNWKVVRRMCRGKMG